MEQNELMRRRITILGGLFVAMMIFLMGFTGGIMRSDSTPYQERIVELEQTINEMDLAAHGLDENGVRLDRMAIFYKNRDPYGGVSLAETDEEFRDYCRENYPEAVYPATEWTADEVIQFYYEAPGIWGYWPNDYSMDGFYFTWTEDYEHCLMLDVGYSVEATYDELDSGWLCVDGVRVQNLCKEVGAVEPLALIEAYQKGEWDGMRRTSTDWSTRVYVDNKGMLSYFYDAFYYDKTTDPEGWAWTGYEEPWWQAEDLDPKVAAALADVSYRPKEESARMAWGQADVRLFVDFPLDYDTTGFYETWRSGGQTFALTANQVILAKAGKVLEQWDLGFEVGEAKFLAAIGNPEPQYAEDLAYLWTDGKVLALRPDGKIAVAVEKVLQVTSDDRRMWGLQGDQLVYWQVEPWGSQSGEPLQVADGVLETDFEELMLVKRADGCYLVEQGSKSATDYQLEYLGEESFEYYEQLYRTLQSGKNYRW